MKLNNVILEEIKAIVGSQHVHTAGEKLREYGADHCHEITPAPAAIVFPGKVEEIASILKLCHHNQIPVVPSAGRTGYSGAATAINGEIILSLERMNRILDLDSTNASITAEAGCILQNIQERVQDAGLLFPVDLAARGSAMVGGLISTNAGGLRVIKYGMTRDNLLGLNIVLPDGEKLNLDRKVHKCNAGYNIFQLFAGAEGTLGIITSATFKLVSPPESPQTLLLALSNPLQIPHILQTARSLKLDLLAFEFYSDSCELLVLEKQSYRRQPFPAVHPWSVLIEIDTHRNADIVEKFAASIFAADQAVDGTIAHHSTMARELWEIRENISECINMNTFYHKMDVALPISALSTALEYLPRLLNNKAGKLLLFGHVGDGNIHVNLIGDDNQLTPEQFTEMSNGFSASLASFILKNGGTMSAEHGIGVLKKELLAAQVSKSEFNLMRGIKRLMDPHNIMNPGKIFDL